MYVLFKGSNSAAQGHHCRTLSVALRARRFWLCPSAVTRVRASSIENVGWWRTGLQMMNSALAGGRSFSWGLFPLSFRAECGVQGVVEWLPLVH
jgi:hypothetical protein